MALKLRSEADELRIKAAIAISKSDARWYKGRANQLLEERRELIAQISPFGIVYNV